MLRLCSRRLRERFSRGCRGCRRRGGGLPGGDFAGRRLHVNGRNAIGRDHHLCEHLVKIIDHSHRHIEIVGGPEHLSPVQHQVDATADRHLLRHQFDRTVDLGHHVLAGFLHDAVPLAERAARRGDAVLEILLARADLFRCELGSVSGECLAEVAECDLLLLRVLVQFLAPGEEFLVGLLICRGGTQHVRH